VARLAESVNPEIGGKTGKNRLLFFALDFPIAGCAIFNAPLQSVAGLIT
jgi:hypothetical protein